jgi:pyrroline-5-carboxylate reductase
MSSVADGVAFIGGGMMATALIGGFIKGGAVSPTSVSIAEPYKPIRDKHVASGFFASASNLDVVTRASDVWLAVKPEVIPTVLAECGATLLAQGSLVVSIAAGVNLATLEGSLPAGVRVIRVMPNLPALVGQCAAGFCRGKHATSADADRVRSL